MIQRDEATEAQIGAAAPDMSTWLSANAGSGKTRVLTDRVARLLLSGTLPQNILCLTYTKAAATEMQNRLFKRLGAWAMMGDTALTQALVELGTDPGADLARARTLFAAAIETPGGLKIQTIHSFCAGLLRRFPLEAGVSPNFTEIEDRAADLLRASVLEEIAEGPHAPDVAALAALVTDESFDSLVARITALGERFRPLDRDTALERFDLPPGLTEAQIVAEALGPGGTDVLERMRQLMAASTGKTEPVKAKLVEGFDPAAPDALPVLETFFLIQAGTVSTRLLTKATRAAAGPMADDFDALAQRVEDARDRRLALAAAEATLVLHRFGTTFAAAYTDAKRARGWLDFDDLITRARALLNDPPVAAWVLYRLDGGIDHILVDEAQDTSPAQWDVIRQLAAEFGAGEGAERAQDRTIFVVGDKKQSIYSFQGADPREFDRMEREFRERLRGADAPFQSRELAYSFRSSPAILRLVDQVFDRMDQVDARHKAFKSELPGRVDLWPVVEPTPTEEDPPFTDPVDRPAATHHNVILAGQVADQIQALLNGDETLPDEEDGQIFRRPIRPRDILILVQRRSGIFGDIIRACKSRGLPIAGADRLKVGAELAVRDIGALLSFLATQDDSLSLACALRSPLFGWTEGQLFELAHGREGSLWRALRAREGEATRVLRDLRGQADFLRPYDLIERILTQHSGRARLLARLGPEAADGIDALLGQALDYERTEVPSLTGFLTWMQTGDLEIKRQVDSASDRIRVMTVHGSKGLEAPIVILPECGPIRADIRDKIVTLGDLPVWKPGSTAMPQVLSGRLAEMKEDMWQERLRLLYVALTRAEKWLIVAAAGKLPDDGRSWYQLVAEAMGHSGAVDLPLPHGTGQRLSHADWTAPPLRPAAKAGPRVTTAVVPDGPAPIPSPPPATLSPSGLGGEKALPGPLGMAEDEALAYGTFVHALLEGIRPKVDLPPSLVADARAEAAAVLADPALAPLFAADALSEVTITADLGPRRLHGTIDKLIVTDSRIIAVDFKTNRTVPQSAAEIPIGLLRQMAAYAHALAQVYPDRRIDTAIVWTHSRTWMDVPHDIVTNIAASMANLDDDATAS